MIGYINRARRAHIVTIEDPIEVVHDDVLSIIQQREVGLDTESYAAALKSVVRQDPDVIFVGEIRDADSALSAIQAAETGHLVISTLHTIDCMETINRVLDLFPPQQSKEVRTSFAGRAPRHRVAAARAEGRREGPRRRRRGAREHRPRLRPSRRPRADGLDRRRDRRGRLLRHAELRPGAREPGEGRPDRRPTRRAVRPPAPTTSICSCPGCSTAGRRSPTIRSPGFPSSCSAAPDTPDYPRDMDPQPTVVDVPAIAKELGARFADAGHELYLVGGSVGT